MTDQSSTARVRAGFTAVEMVVVIGIMLLLMSMAVPTVIPALRKGALHSAGADIESVWQQARIRAMNSTVPSGATPPYYGITISQTSGQPASVALVYDNVGLGSVPQTYRVGQVATDASTFSAANAPLLQYFFNRNVLLQIQDMTGTFISGTKSLTVYVQYSTGFPISPTDVSLGNGQNASPMSFGVSSPVLTNTSLSPLMLLQTYDYQQGVRGYSDAVSLFHTGILTLNPIQE